MIHALRLIALLAVGASAAFAQPVVFADGIEGPRGLAQLADGRVLVTAFSGNAVVAFAADGTPLGTFASDIADPVPIHQLADGRVLVGEFNTGTIRAFSAAGTALPDFATGLDGPVDITQLGSGMVLISENYTPSARAFSPAGEDQGPYVTSVTDSGAATGTTQLADGRIVLTVSGPFEAVQAFSAGGSFLSTLVMAGDALGSVNAVLQLADGRLAVLDGAFGEVEGFTTSGDALGVIAAAPGILTDFVQLADGRLLVAEADGLVYAFGFATDEEGRADAQTARLDVSPNPTRGAATLRIAHSTPGPVRVTVHDALGRRVAVVHDGPLAAGDATFPLDARRLRPGLYLVRMTAPDATAVQRLTVVH